MTEAVTATVDSRQKWNHVAALESGVEYRIQPASPGQTWVDWGRTCGPNGYEAWFTPLARWLRRRPSSPWFALIGVIGDGAPFEIGNGTVVRAEVGGDLRCYANDIPFMYWNNRGSIEVMLYPTG
jgi:hypothetical protein